MSDMKYLMLFEAFESNALSKMMKFLKSKVDNNSKERFLDKLKTLMTKLNVPIDKISDKDVKYLNRNQALKIRATEENESDLYCLKFWFSMDEGYLGFTGTGDRSMDFNRYLKGRRSYRAEQNKPFNDIELDYIKNTLDIKTGKLTPVKDYNELQHGQLVIGVWDEEYEDLNRLSLAKIWRDEYGHLYAIQNVADGGTPDYYVNGVHWTQWRNQDPKFRESWSMGDVDSPAGDHGKLHIYTPSDEPIHVVGKRKEEEKKKESNPFDFNLPVNVRFELNEWGETNWSIDDYKLVEKSDFAIVLMISDVLKSVETGVGDVKKARIESREGATKLMDDSQIREANIKRYLLALVDKMGIAVDTSNLQNLQKLVIKAICGDFAFIAIKRDRPSFGNLNNIVSNIYNIIESNTEADKKYYLDRSILYYERLSNNTENIMKLYIKSLEAIESSNNKEIKDFFNIAIGIGNKIKKYLLSQNIQSIEDLQMIITKLESIRNISYQKMFTFDGVISSIIESFEDTSDVEYYIKEYGNRDISKEMKNIKNLDRYVDSLLR